MKLKKQVVNKKLSQKIKEMGVKRERLWCWVHEEDYGFQIHFSNDNAIKNKKNRWNYYAAFTASELGEMLPLFISKDIGRLGYKIMVLKNEWIDTVADTEADARAQMLIYLIENKLMEIPK